MHCHIEWHMMLGMAAILRVRPYFNNKDKPKPSSFPTQSPSMTPNSLVKTQIPVNKSPQYFFPSAKPSQRPFLRTSKTMMPSKTPTHHPILLPTAMKEVNPITIYTNSPTRVSKENPTQKPTSNSKLIQRSQTPTCNPTYQSTAMYRKMTSYPRFRPNHAIPAHHTFHPSQRPTCHPSPVLHTSLKPDYNPTLQLPTIKQQRLISPTLTQTRFPTSSLSEYTRPSCISTIQAHKPDYNQKQSNSPTLAPSAKTSASLLMGPTKSRSANPTVDSSSDSKPKKYKKDPPKKSSKANKPIKKKAFNLI